MAQGESMKTVRALARDTGLTAAEVRAELQRVLAHREFQATDKLRDFLRFVVEETLAGRADRLKGYTIALEVFARGDDFDPAHDPIVRIQAGRLRLALERYYLVAGGDDPVQIDIPKGRYVPRFTRPSQAAKTAHGVGAHSAIGPSVAVMPLQDLSEESLPAFFTIGLAEDLVTELNRFQDIIVVPCRRAALASETGIDAETVGRRAGARFVLRGTVRRDAKAIKVSIRLIDATADRQVWARGFKYGLEAASMIATQEEIARSVVAAVASEHGIIARRLSAESRKKPPADLDTYEAMLRYYGHQITPTPESARICFEALRRAAEREPDYGPVWSALATLHCQMWTFDAPGFEESLGTALDHARRGVALEPGSQIGRLILAYASYLAEDLDSFQHEIENTLALNPNSPYHVGTAGYFHVMVGEFDRGLRLLDRAIATNPCHPDWFHTAHFIEYLRRGDHARALRELESHRPLQSFWLPVGFAAVLGKLDRRDQAAVHLDELRRLKPDFASRARELMRRSLKVDAVIEEVIDGLRRAGLTVEDRAR